MSYIPETDYEGPDRFTFKVADPYSESEPGTLTIRVERQNRPPLARDQTIVVHPDSSAAVLLDAFDPDGDPFQTIILKGPARGRVYGIGTNFVYRPSAQFTGGDRFTYKLWDGQKFGNPAQVNINVIPPEPENPLAFESLRRRDQFVELTIRPGSAASFAIQSSSNLLDWSRLIGPLSRESETQVYLDTNSASPRRFYRAVAE